MTAEQFRKLALALPGAVEAAHMKHPDFRVGGRIFATLGYPDEQSGMVKLPPELQRKWVEAKPEVFRPCNGAWGRQGCTGVTLEGITSRDLKALMQAAFELAASRVKPARPARAAKRRRADSR